MRRAHHVGQRFSANTSPQNAPELVQGGELEDDLRQWHVGGGVQWQNRLYNMGTTAGVAWRNQQGAHAVADLIVGYRLAPGAGGRHSAQHQQPVRQGVLPRHRPFDRMSTDVDGEPRAIKVTARYTF